MVFGQREMVSVGGIEVFVEASEQFRHGKVHAAVAKVNGGVDKHGFFIAGAEKVSAPEVAMKQRWFLLREDGSQFAIEWVEHFLNCFVEIAIFSGQLYLWPEPAVFEE